MPWEVGLGIRPTKCWHVFVRRTLAFVSSIAVDMLAVYVEGVRFSIRFDRTCCFAISMSNYTVLVYEKDAKKGTNQEEHFTSPGNHKNADFSMFRNLTFQHISVISTSCLN